MAKPVPLHSMGRDQRERERKNARVVAATLLRVKSERALLVGSRSSPRRKASQDHLYEFLESKVDNQAIVVSNDFLSTYKTSFGNYGIETAQYSSPAWRDEISTNGTSKGRLSDKSHEKTNHDKINSSGEVFSGCEDPVWLSTRKPIHHRASAKVLSEHDTASKSDCVQKSPMCTPARIHGHVSRAVEGGDREEKLLTRQISPAKRTCNNARRQRSPIKTVPKDIPICTDADGDVTQYSFKSPTRATLRNSLHERKSSRRLIVSSRSFDESTSYHSPFKLDKTNLPLGRSSRKLRVSKSFDESMAYVSPAKNENRPRGTLQHKTQSSRNTAVMVPCGISTEQMESSVKKIDGLAAMGSTTVVRRMKKSASFRGNWTATSPSKSPTKQAQKARSTLEALCDSHAETPLKQILRESQDATKCDGNDAKESSDENGVKNDVRNCHSYLGDDNVQPLLDRVRTMPTLLEQVSGCSCASSADASAYEMKEVTVNYGEQGGRGRRLLSSMLHTVRQKRQNGKCDRICSSNVAL
jgi:hypothetical protein